MQIQPDIAYSTPQDILALLETWEFTMKGGIYSDQKCFCGQKFKHFETEGIRCSKHHTSSPTRLVVRFGGITRRFRSYPRAYRFLTGLRHETDMGKFDPRDYRSDNPLGFENCVQRFLDAKKDLKGWKKYEQRLRFATSKWANKNVKEIKYGDIEDLLSDLRCSSYYKYHIACSIRMLFNWLLKREEIQYEI